MTRLALAVTLLLICAGCQERERKKSVYSPGEPYDILQSSGDRVVITDGEGERLAKLRVVSEDRWDVYDADFVRRGAVRRLDDRVELRRGRTGEWEAAEAEANAWSASGAFRIEAVARGWAVFDRENELVGYLEKSGDEWLRRQSYSGEPRLSIAANADRIENAHGRLAYEIAGEVEPAIVLSLTFEELDPVSAVAVGALVSAPYVDRVRGEPAEAESGADAGGDAVGADGSVDGGSEADGSNVR